MDPSQRFSKTQKEIKFTALKGPKPITESWARFKQSIPTRCTPEFFAIIKQAYFAGALSLYGALMVGLDDSTQSETTEDLAKMERIHSELFEFKDRMRDFLTEAITEGQEWNKAQ